MPCNELSGSDRSVDGDPQGAPLDATHRTDLGPAARRTARPRPAPLPPDSETCPQPIRPTHRAIPCRILGLVTTRSQGFGRPGPPEAAVGQGAQDRQRQGHRGSADDRSATVARAAHGLDLHRGRGDRAGRLRGARVHLRHELRGPHLPARYRTPGGRSTSVRSTRPSGSTPSTRRSATGSGLQGYDADASPSADHLLGPARGRPGRVHRGPRRARGGARADLARPDARPVPPGVGQRAGRRPSMNPASPFSGFALIERRGADPG